ncbi:42207_t:CDS:2 [Gigaspora margarita]|uniref:42207_t:CDS:1 n=1 Tax=Gigaspora margarita TaxID=4874 RepID=A0ABN7V571_GIGMA|nr:42207_t:CDS:2 [Gigaspora margarita]
MAPETNNLTKVQDNTIKIDDSAKEIEEICEQSQGRLQGRYKKECKEKHKKKLIQLILADQDEF